MRCEVPRYALLCAAFVAAVGPWLAYGDPEPDAAAAKISPLRMSRAEVSSNDSHPIVVAPDAPRRDTAASAPERAFLPATGDAHGGDGMWSGTRDPATRVDVALPMSTGEDMPLPPGVSPEVHRPLIAPDDDTTAPALPVLVPDPTIRVGAATVEFGDVPKDDHRRP